MQNSEYIKKKALSPISNLKFQRKNANIISHRMIIFKAAIYDIIIFGWLHGTAFSANLTAEYK
jgi:hypothetical protein